MRYRIDDYTIVVASSSVKVYLAYPGGVAKSASEIEEAIRLIIDEDAKAVLCSSMQKDLITDIQSDSTYAGRAFYVEFDIPAGKTITASDKFTIEFDWGEAPSANAQETTLGTSPDTSVSTTIFGWLKSIRDFLVGIVTTNPYAKESSVSNATTSHTTIGMLEDSTNGLKAIKDKLDAHNTEVVTTHPYAKEATIGAATDEAAETTSSSLFAWIRKIRDYLYGIVTTSPYAKEATLGTSSDTSSDATIFGKMAGVSSQIGSDQTKTVHTKLTELSTALLGGCEFTQYGEQVGTDEYTLVIDASVNVESETLIV